MAWLTVFQTQCDVFDPEMEVGSATRPELRGVVLVGVDLDGGAKKARVRVEHDGKTVAAEYPFDGDAVPDPFVPSAIETLELTLDLSKSDIAKRLSDAGAVGLNLALPAELQSVTIRLRGPNDGGFWTSDAPFFAIFLCWKLKGEVATGNTVLLEDKDGKTTPTKLAAKLTAEPVVCAGFSAIHPHTEELTPADLQVRLDLESLGLSTGWQPLQLIDDGWLSGNHMNGLARWFGALADALDDFADLFKDVDLPDWDLDLDVDIDLPLGLAFRETRLSVTQEMGAYIINASAEGLILRWGEASEFEIKDARLALTAKSGGSGWIYVIEATLFETKGEAVDFALPFDVLSLSVACWRFRLGLHASNATGNAMICPEALIELGGAEIRSSLSDGGSEPLYSTELRVLMRNFTVMFADLAEASAPVLFEEYKDLAPFKDYAEKIPALSFARDFSAEPAPDNDYGISVIGGDVRKGERLYVAWSQRGNQLLKALAHDLMGSAPAGKLPDDAEEVKVALELAWFGEEDDRDTQLRIDWQTKDAAPLTPGGTASSPSKWENLPKAAPTHKCIAWEDLANNGLSLPIGSAGVNLADPMAKARRMDLPGMTLEVAEPTAHSIVLRQDAGGETSVGYLLIYDAPSPAGSKPAAAIAKARFGFSLSDPETGARETMDTNEGDFATLAMGFGGAEPTALRVIGWKPGQSPRFVEAYERGAQTISPLLPEKAPSGGELGCPVPAPPPKSPVSLAFDSFAAPRFDDAKGWRMSMAFAAQSAFFKLFGGGDASTAPVTYKITNICLPLNEAGKVDTDATHVLIDTRLTVNLGDDFFAEGDVRFRFEPGTLALAIESETQLAVSIATLHEGGKLTRPGWADRVPLPEVPEGRKYAFSEEKSILNLKANFLAEVAEGAQPQAIDFLKLTINEGRFKLALPDDKRMVVRFDGLGNDSLNFWADSFEIGPGGLDLEARLVSSALNVKGLKKPFALKDAGLRIRESRLETLSIAASGALPELFDDAPVELAIAFVQNKPGDPIELDELVCELGKKGAPIFSRGTRFKFEIVKLDLRYQRPSPDEDRHFFFEITGSAEFAPDPGEFAGGLLEDLKAVRIDFLRAPVTDEFAKHIRLVVELNEPKSFGVYNLFKMEIRSIGFVPHFDNFNGPAIVLGGQMEFADVGDVIAAEIDFHSMYIGMPKAGEALPQVHFDGLRVEISSPEGFKIAGRVDRYNSETLQGFGGEGTIQIPGFPELSAAFAFVKLRGDETERFRRGWFVAIEAAKISYQMGTLPLYLRQIGLGFGYRYTLPLIREFEQKTTLRELIDRMLKALDRHQTLARLDSWVPDPEAPGQRPRWTIALETVFTLSSSQIAPFDYNARKEKKVKTVIAQLLAAIRSDFTLLAAAKVWFPVSVDDFFENEEGMRNRPLARGFMIFSVPQKRFLAHAAKGKNPYMGKPNDPVPDVVKNVLNNSHFEATMLIEPSLLHAELGWPDRLMFKMSVGSLQLECRGGVLFRAENDVLIHGIFFSARGSLDLSGGISLGFVGFRVSAQVRVYFAMRLMTALYLSRPLSSKIYAQVGLDVAVRFSVQAWLRIKIGFCKISITISFSFELQIVIGLDVGWAGGGAIGFRGRATVVLTVFGRRLSARVAVGLNDSAVERARIALLPYMRSFLEPGEIPPVPDGTLQRRVASGPIEDAVVLSETPGPKAAAVAKMPLEGKPKALSAKAKTALLETAKEDEFVTSHLRIARGADGGTSSSLIWIMPAPGGAAFYPALAVPADGPDEVTYATLTLPDDTQVWAYDGGAFKSYQGKGTEVPLKARPKSGLRMEVDGKAGQSVTMTLQQMLAGCYAVTPKAYVDMKGAGEQEDDQFFPEFWPAKKVALFLPEEDKLEAAQKDDRIHDPNDPARRPRRQIDPVKSEYDAVLVDALDTGDEKVADAYAGQPDDPNTDALQALRRQIQEQAEGNQTYLLQTFYDDLVKLAEAYETSGDWAQAIKALGDDRPTVLDTGLLLRVDGPLPNWAVKRSKKMKAEDYPTISFNGDVTEMPQDRLHGVELERDGYALFPIVDFENADFDNNKPVIRAPVVYFDEEVIGLSWELDWPSDAPEAAKGAENGPEHFLRHYRVDFLDLSTNQPLGSYTCLPSDLAGKAIEQDGGGYRRKRLQSRYKITVPTSELFPEGLSDTQVLRRVSATVLPIGQTGGIGVGRSFVLSEEPTLTPLPPDEANLALFGWEARPKEGEPSAKPHTYFARLAWRKLSLPSGPGIARTDAWDIVLRPLDRVPMGAYPNEASDATDRGLMSQTGQDLQEGDVIIRLADLPPGHKDLPKGVTVRRPNLKEEDDDRDAADTVIEILFDPDRPDTFEPADDSILDHLGRPAPPGSYPYQAVQDFIDRKAGDSHAGRGWRVFLRAVSHRADTGGEEGEANSNTVSGLVPVRLHLQLPEVTTRLSDDDLRQARRPLPHFEWPSVPDLAEERRVPDLGWQAGAAHIPVPMAEDGKTKLSDILGSTISIEYRPEPGRARAVSLSWSAVAILARSPRNYASICEYALSRAALDDMLNADVAEAEDFTGFRPNWQHVARILPSDRQVSQQTPDTMNDAQNWVAWPPSMVARMAWMDEAGLPRKTQAEAMPGWFSWAESELIWPHPEKGGLADFIEKGRDADLDTEDEPAKGRSPLERLVALDKIPLKGMSEEDLQVLLAAWADLGQQAVGRALHPYLLLIAGRLAVTDRGSLGVAYDLQASTGAPVSETDPLKWLRQNSAAIDPYGWNGLGHLGLSVNLALRSKTTGLVLPQEKLRKALAAAIGEVDDVLEAAGLADPGTFKRERHLAIDFPLQTASALRAGPGEGEIANSGLGMQQLALRPIPRDVFAYSRFAFTDALERLAPETPFTFPHAVELIFANTPKPNEKFRAGDTITVRGLFSPGDMVLVRHLVEGGEPGTVLADALEMLHKEKLLSKRQDKFLWPLAADPAAKLSQVSPYERFVGSDAMIPRLKAKTDGHHANASFQHFVDYLTGAFRSLDDAGNPKPNTVPSFAADEDIRAYLAWSDRLFAVAPLELPEKMEGVWPGEGVMRSAGFAAPKTMDPLRISPNAEGQLAVTQRVTEEWAMTRAYSLVATRRYDALHRAVRTDDKGLVEAEPDLKDPRFRADIQLPRVRKIEPPQVLAQRLLPDADATHHFHEVTMATHAEEGLSNSNIRMMRKIEFGGVYRSFERAFVYQSWIAALELTGETPRLPGNAARATSDTLFDLSDHDSDYLAHVPQARWGSNRMTTPAAPFYYDQSMRYLATGGEEQSVIRALTLIRPLADGPHVASESEPVVPAPAPWGGKWEAETELQEVFDKKQVLFESWSATLGTKGLEPGGWSVAVRAPMLFEGLPPKALAHLHKAEEEAQTVGRLPDPEVTLHLTTMRDGATSVLARLTPDLEKAPGFFSTQVAPAAHVGPLEVKGQDKWSDGITLHVIVAETGGAVSKVLASGVTPAIPDAKELVDPSSAMLEPDSLPKAGPLAQLAGLAIRLHLVGPDGSKSLQMLRPLSKARVDARSDVYEAFPRSSLRASMRVGGAEGGLPMQRADLGVGLLVLTDLERRRAAGLLSFDIGRDEAQADVVQSVIRDLMGLLETAAAGYVTPPTDLADFPDALWQRLADQKIELWRRMGSDGETPAWTKLAELPDFDDMREVLVLATDPDAPSMSAFNDVVAKYGDAKRPAVAESLAAYRLEIGAFAETVPVPPTPARLTVHAQRGSRARTLWAKAEEESGDATE